MRFLLLFTLITFSYTIQAQTMTAEELLDMSIQFHDPMGRWQTAEMEMVLKMEMPFGFLKMEKRKKKQSKS